MTFIRNTAITTVLLLFQVHSVHSQLSKVDGSVSDREGNELIGATVQVEGTLRGTTTDFNGNFSLELQPEDSVLLVTYIGFLSERVRVNGQSSLSIVLVEDQELLEEVVVVGYGTIRKSDLTGSVGTVNTEQIQKFATLDAGRAIQGKVAGVQVTANSGAPGSGSAIRVRGVGSFQNADPLFVVDGFITKDISNISPNDIQSMEVLKDASATAIYGSRGANGVIIITTKKGKKGLQVELNAYTGTQSKWNTIDMLDSRTYALAYLETVGGNFTDIENESLRFWIRNSEQGTNWQEEVFQDAPISSVNVAVRGGTEKVKYQLGGSVLSNEGIVINTESVTYQANMSVQYQVTDKITVNAGVKYSKSSFTPYDADPNNSILGTALRKDPVNPVVEPVSNDWFRTNLTDIPNPVRRATEQEFRLQESDRIQPNIGLTYEVLPGITIGTSAVWDDRDTERHFLTPSNITVERNDQGDIVQNPNESFLNTTYTYQTNTLNVFQNTNTLSLEKKIGGHSINGVLGFELYTEQQRNESFNVLVDPNYSVALRDDPSFNPNLSGDFPDNIQEESRELASVSVPEFNLLSYFARLVYSYNDKYLFTATVRRDGSSKFEEENRWGTFPSFSLGWNLDAEPFFPESNVLTGVKLRSGWGQVGNSDPVAPFQTLSILQPGWIYPFSNEAESPDGLAATFLPASDLRWEISETTNFGVDLAFLQNRLTISTDYYVRQTRDLLVLRPPVPVFAGAGAPSSNVASMRNTGLEFTLDYTQDIKDFTLSAGGNISFVDNEVTSLGAGESLIGANYEPRTRLSFTRTIVGQDFASFFGLISQGIFDSAEEVDAHGVQPSAQPGDIRYLDANDDGLISAEDAQFIGSPVPDFTYGFYLNLAYKGIDLSVSFAGTQGNDIANAFRFYNANSDARFGNLTVDRYENRWTGPGSSGTEPRLTTQLTQNEFFSDRYIEDGSFLRMRNVQLGYVIPSKVYEKLKIKSVRVYVSADNLLTWTNYSGFDPEVGLAFNGDPFGNGVDLGNFPTARVIIFGTNIKF